MKRKLLASSLESKELRAMAILNEIVKIKRIPAIHLLTSTSYPSAEIPQK